MCSAHDYLDQKDVLKKYPGIGRIMAMLFDTSNTVEQLEKVVVVARSAPAPRCGTSSR